MTHDFEKVALDARLKTLSMIYKAQKSHIGSNFSCTDIFSVLFTKYLNIPADLPEDRDRFILSKGWAAATLYYFLAEKGVIPKEDLEKFCVEGSKYIGLAEPYVDGVEFAGGSMGHGLPAAVGMALAAKLAGKDYKVFCLMSDGELNCGTTWESMAIASQHKLDNLFVFVDANGLQAMGHTNDVLRMEPIYAKFESFGAYTFEVNGHDHTEIEASMDERLGMKELGMPTAFICHTIKGRGVKEFENKVEWHYRNIPEDIYNQALKELV